MRGGNTGDDTHYGGPSARSIFAEGGVDAVYGGDGNDDLWAMARGDVEKPPGRARGHRSHGGAGDDRIHVRDGEADSVRCGAATTW